MQQPRLRFLFSLFALLILAVIARLFYWQVLNADQLSTAALSQYLSQTKISPRRGQIITADDFPLVFNQPRYTLAAYTPNLKLSPPEVADRILAHLQLEIDDPALATEPAKLQAKLNDLRQSLRSTMITRLQTKKWAPLARNLSLQEKEAIEAQNITGLSFEESFTRYYPEASMSAHLLGFVGKNKISRPVGYFGLEGFYDEELRGAGGLVQQEKDAFGNPLLTGFFRAVSGQNGRSLKLYLDHTLQYLVEQELKKGLERYQASSGEVVVMDPSTGGILAMASFPNYDPSQYWRYDPVLYKNPVIANTYEPGSTFKTLVMAAALEEKAVHPEDKCDICGAPLKIGQYTIRTWDNKYQEGRTPEEILVHSDNVGMVWIQRRLGGDKLLSYLKKFGFGQKTGIDLQEEVAAPLKKNWSEIDYATAAFGQGIAVTSIQMVRAVAAIANGGLLMEPHVVKTVIGPRQVISLKPKVIRRVISSETAHLLTQMMVASAEHGEAKWTYLKGYQVAGKTGTAQIPVAGHYDEEKTIASFIGFAPADNPRFVMLVKLREPQTSPWGSETAAPLWFSIAKKILIHFNIPPSN